MSEPISVGDLVRVVGGHCAGFVQEAQDVIFVVHTIRTLARPYCLHCHKTMNTTLAAESSGDWSIPVRWLKRIPPLSELEGEKRDETVSA